MNETEPLRLLRQMADKATALLRLDAGWTGLIPDEASDALIALRDATDAALFYLDNLPAEG